MIVVQGNIPLKAEARDRAIKLAMEIEGISKQEVGCLGYQFYVALTDPLELVLFQQWESVEALRKHYQTFNWEKNPGGQREQRQEYKPLLEDLKEGKKQKK